MARTKRHGKHAQRWPTARFALSACLSYPCLPCRFPIARAAIGAESTSMAFSSTFRRISALNGDDSARGEGAGKERKAEKTGGKLGDSANCEEEKGEADRARSCAKGLRRDELERGARARPC